MICWGWPSHPLLYPAVQGETIIVFSITVKSGMLSRLVLGAKLDHSCLPKTTCQSLLQPPRCHYSEKLIYLQRGGEPRWRTGLPASFIVFLLSIVTWHLSRWCQNLRRPISQGPGGHNISPIKDAAISASQWVSRGSKRFKQGTRATSVLRLRRPQAVSWTWHSSDN